MFIGPVVRAELGKIIRDRQEASRARVLCLHNLVLHSGRCFIQFLLRAYNAQWIVGVDIKAIPYRIEAWQSDSITLDRQFTPDEVSQVTFCCNLAASRPIDNW